MAQPTNSDGGEYSPVAVLLDVRHALERAGIDIDPGPNQMHVASLAAADMLRALGVQPAAAPRRRGGGAAPRGSASP